MLSLLWIFVDASFVDASEGVLNTMLLDALPEVKGIFESIKKYALIKSEVY